MADVRDDAAARRNALDVERSFIVEAPAGSGKTELLIQRYLSLLLRVDEPEQVVAITFTRKAAAEMRVRVVGMLTRAQDGAVAIEPHRVGTLRLAEAVLGRDAEREWSILSRPGRLRIDTVDALNAWLADRLPVLAGAVAGGAIAEDAATLYSRAASRALEAGLTETELRPHIRHLLALADNSLDHLVRAMAAVLPLRDQWLALAAEDHAEGIRAALAASLEHVVSHRLDSLADRLGPDLCAGIESALSHAARYSEKHADLAGDSGLLARTGADLAGRHAAWQAAAALLLTATGQLRRRFTRSEGFLSAHTEAKRQVIDLVDAIADIPGADQALSAVRALPAPAVEEAQVEDALAVRVLLRQAVAELKVGFQHEQQVDFLELALGAQQALGAVDEPSDLLLALDRRIEHFLVDEFQDTSHSQFRLLELLTAGWTEGDGRTLFLVGDPMQSIYRFRNADMSLFLRAKSSGIGTIKLHRLTLRKNFRSSPAIVDWVNDTFSRIFPGTDDAELGIAGYAPFAATVAASDEDRVLLHRVASSRIDAQQRCVARIAAAELDDNNAASVAVLVQSRSHLAGLREELERHGIETRAVELDTLAEQPVVQDLLALTRAMLHYDDRIAWLAILRAPWCGLTWSEIHALCADAPDRSVWDVLNDDERLSRIEDRDSAARIGFLRNRLARAEALRGRYTLPRWIECCWQLLDGPACLRRPTELELVGHFVQTLAGACVEGDVEDPATLDRAFAIPFAPAPTAAGERAIEIMTIHRAKGLEFDTVIMFGLERRLRPADPKIVYWQETPAGLLYSPICARAAALTRYLQGVDRALDTAERARLLYVAVTRARRRLHLVGHLAPVEAARGAAVPAGTLMAGIADQFAATVPDVASTEVAEPGAGAWIVPGIDRLEAADDVPIGPLASADIPPATPRTPYEWAGPAAAHVGTVVHRALHRAGGGDVAEIAARLGLDASAEDRYVTELKLLGVPPAEQSAAAGRVCEVLRRVLADKTGAWILADHDSAESELELTVSLEGEPVHMRLDRTFVDQDGTRWIIDYKTSRHAGGHVDAFLDSEVTRYRDQLERYAAAMHQIDPRPMRVGLYFPLLAAFRDWVPAVSLRA